ncbi:Phosphate metabolism transcription protein [Dipsacomyces acuminosporus]|nr:Phosphate metabolism transcription protein [Dipsacomyces acuminosporus]
MAVAGELHRQLDKVSSFVHMKGAELEHTVGSCELYLMSLSALDYGEQLVGLSQIEETIGSAISQIPALARFRRSNFTALWRSLSRLRRHCQRHFEELVDLIASSSLFHESDTLTVYFDDSAMTKYQSGLSVESPTKESLQLWRSEQDNQIVHLEQSSYTGPWFAGSVAKTSATLGSQYVLPFLNSDFNFDRIRPTTKEEEVKEEEESATQRRARARTLQRIQRHIIMENLSPVLLATEERAEYADPANPGIRIVLKRNAAISYDERMSQHTASTSDNDDGLCWLQQLLDDRLPNGPTPATSVVERLPFATIEVHLDNNSNGLLPDWLHHLFFESSLVHPVLDFDLYSHGIALMHQDKVESLPYWLVDYYRDVPCPLTPSPTARSQSSRSLQPSVEGPLDGHSGNAQDTYTESTPLLPAPVSARSGSTPPLGRHTLAKRIRYALGIALLAAMALSIAIATWPYHEQLLQFLAELADVIAQWVFRLLDAA